MCPRFLRAVLRRREVKFPLGPRVLDANQLGSGPRLFKGFRDDEGNGLVIVLDGGPTQQRRVVEDSFAQLPGVFRGHNGEHSGRRPGGGQVDRSNRSLGNCAAKNPAIGLVGDDVVTFIGIGCSPRRLQRSLNAIRGFADDLQLVNRIVTGRSINFISAPPSLPPAPRPACVRPV